MDAPRRVQVLGLPVDALDRVALLDHVAGFVRDRRRATVAYLNVHVANSAYEDPTLHAFLRTVDLCYCDGSGVRLGARLLGETLPERMTGADWIWDLATRAEQDGWRLAWVGGEPGVADAALDQLRARHPRLVAQAWHGFHDAEATPPLLAAINDFRPDIVLVGMGTPLQERWTAAHRATLDAPVVWCLGATADFVAGKTARGPQWMLDNHLEWLARLVVEPRRLWRRYLLGNPIFLARVLRERVGSSSSRR